MTGKHHPPPPEGEQVLALHPPVDDEGWHTSQVRDWVGVSPELSDAAVRLYLILRALVIDKRGPVRKLTLWELCHLLPARGAKKGGGPSSISRIRNLLRELAAIGLVTTPDGKKFSTSSRALASGRGVSMRINVMPVKTYKGPRNVFDVLDRVRASESAEKSARRARQRELELAAERRAKQAEERAGQNSDPGEAGQNSDPSGQNSDPSGQNSDPHSGTDLQDREPPHSPPAQTPLSDSAASVRPSVQVGEAPACETDGRTDGGSGIEGQGGTAPGAGRELPPDHALERTPGVEVLAAIGAEAPEWKIIGTWLRDQGRSATLLLERGFTPQEIRHALLSRPVPQPLTHTLAAVIGGRLRELAMSLPAVGIRPIPEQAGPVLRERCTTLAAERTKDEALERRVMQECANCRAPIGGDKDLCAKCSGRPTPRCSAGCGRAVLADGLVCLSCDVPDDIGVCPGHTEPCGRPVISQGLCRHCLIIAEQERAAREREYEHQVAAAVAAVAATDGQQGA